MTESKDKAEEPVSEGEPASGSGTCPIVGIGASAGGVEALKRFFAAVDPDEAMAYVVVQHLDPDHESTLPQLIARISKVPVKKITDHARVEPRHAYVIPPNATLTLEDGTLKLTSPGEPRGQRSPIDHFFTSLAFDRGEDAACIILSGTGSDGTIGLRAIKEHGGLALAQADAEYDGMMRSALGTGLVDGVLPVEDMPKRIADYFRFAPSRPSRRTSTIISIRSAPCCGRAPGTTSAATRTSLCGAGSSAACRCCRSGPFPNYWSACGRIRANSTSCSGTC